MCERVGGYSVTVNYPFPSYITGGTGYNDSAKVEDLPNVVTVGVDSRGRRTIAIAINGGERGNWVLCLFEWHMSAHWMTAGVRVPSVQVSNDIPALEGLLSYLFPMSDKEFEASRR